MSNPNLSGLQVGGIHRASWTDEAAELRAHRGEWRLLVERKTRDGARTTASQINRGVLWAFNPPGDFEARVDRHKNEVYVRYLGDGIEAAA